MSKLLVILFSFVLKTIVVNIGLTAAIIYPTDGLCDEMFLTDLLNILNILIIHPFSNILLSNH